MNAGEAMTDFWVAITLTFIVSLFTVLADWVASRMIFGARALRSIRGILGSGLSTDEVVKRVSSEIDRFRITQSNSLVWGSDLATVALALDFSTLGLWLHNTSNFPFFSRFNDPGISREIPVWLILIGIHAILLTSSIAFKHKHGEAMGSMLPSQWQSFPNRLWFTRNRWQLGGNALGFMALLSSIAAIMNTI
jgi:hypothetical protein